MSYGHPQYEKEPNPGHSLPGSPCLIHSYRPLHIAMNISGSIGSHILRVNAGLLLTHLR